MKFKHVDTEQLDTSKHAKSAERRRDRMARKKKTQDMVEFVALCGRITDYNVKRIDCVLKE